MDCLRDPPGITRKTPDQSALWELLETREVADVDDRIRSATETLR